MCIFWLNVASEMYKKLDEKSQIDEDFYHLTKLYLIRK